VSQILSADEAAAQCAAWRSAGRRVVFTNGHFDVLHLGHVEYLERARALGDGLVVGVNGDASTRALKGLQRPIVPAIERARLIAALRCVDAAVIFESLTAEALVARRSEPGASQQPRSRPTRRSRVGRELPSGMGRMIAQRQPAGQDCSPKGTLSTRPAA
jgi:cytidyltransferase-like protein